MSSDPIHLIFIRANQWMHAIEMQSNRITGPFANPTKDGMVKYRLDWNQKQRDLDFFLIALNRFRKGIASGNKQIKSREIEEALISFDQNVPDVKALRDIGEHFDDYDLGRGKLKKHLTNESQSVGWGPEDGNINYRGKKITIKQSREAARKLHQIVMHVLEANGKEIILDEWPLVKYKKF